MSTEVVVQIEAGVAVLTLNRPEHLNAYTAATGASLSQAYRDCDEDVNAVLERREPRFRARLSADWKPL